MTGTLLLPDGRTAEVHDGLVVGRLPSCEVTLDVEGVSRRHARFIVEAGVVEVEDLGSRNGTLLNGKAVTRRVVRDGDRIGIGRAEITFRESARREAPSAAPVPQAGEDLLAGQDLLADARPVPPPGSPSAPPTEPEIIEFVDEVVRVAPAAGPAARPAGARRPTGTVAGTKHAPRRGGLLAEDLGQLGGAAKAVLIVAGLGFAGLVGWLVMRLASG